MVKYICPECGSELIEGKDIHNRCYTCPYCGAEECDLSNLKIINDDKNNN